MIAPLRARHRATWLVLALAIPSLFVASIAVRPEWPEDDVDDPRRLPGNGYRVLGGSATIAEAALSVRVESNELVIEQLDGPTVPDPLLYWTSTVPAAGDGLPDDAIFLGAVGGRPRRVEPPDVASGALVLYSGAHGRRVAALPLPLED